MKALKLKNGSEEAEPLVLTTMMAINRIQEDMPIALYDLVMIARDCDYQPFGQIGPELIKSRLLEQDGSMHQSIRNIVLSSFEGEGMDLVRVNPLSA